jgi:uncharacterized protein YegP (UPF0339 family)
MHIEIYLSAADDQWYWRTKNGGRVTTDAEGYVSKGNAVRAAKAHIKGVFKPVSGSMQVQFTLQKRAENEFVLNWSAY